MGVRIDPAGREAWLRSACGGDADLSAEVGRLLALDERANRFGFLTPPEATDAPPNATLTWSGLVEAAPSDLALPACAGSAPAGEATGFTPRPVLATPTGRHTISEPADVVRARLAVSLSRYNQLLGEVVANPDAEAPAAKPHAATRPVDRLTEAHNYIYGQGVPQDCGRGLRLLKPMASQKNPKAMGEMGALYSAGLCTPRDLPTAYYWFALASRKDPSNDSINSELQKLWGEMTQPERQLAIKLTQ